MQFIEPYLDKIKELCALYHVRNLYVFGSAITPHFSKDSDVDFLVEFEIIPVLEYADNYFDLKFGLEELLGRRIDLLEMQALRNTRVKDRINRTKQAVYAHG